MGKYFGTDGFRGTANKKLTAEQAFKLGRFLGFYYSDNGKRKPKIVVGKDTRLSSYMIESAISSGLSSSGADVYLLHVITTPGVAYVSRTEDFDLGIMITASHNPFCDNGIKLISSSGDKICDEVIDKAEDYLDGKMPEAPYATDEKIGKLIDYSAGRNRYIGHLISLAAHSSKGMRIGLDCANGSSWMIAKSVFNALGAETFVINDTPSGININKECGSTHIGKLRELVINNNLDAGFAFDGDADRCIAVDEKGNIVDGDGMIYIFSRHMKASGILPNNTAVVTVMSNSGLFNAMEKENIALEITDVGDRFVSRKMIEKGYMLGGENSGHIILGKYANTGDGILTAIMLTEVILSEKKSFSELHSDLTLYPQITENLRVSDMDKIVEDSVVIKTVKEINEGVLKKGRLLLRKSGTEPVIRITAEGETEEIILEGIKRVKDVISERGVI